jgi:prepilin-type N-terminal cleavage/methylation domain-containing protein
MMDDGLLMMGGGSFSINRQSSIINHPCRGHTLVEVITVVSVLSILACVAVPRLNPGVVWGAKADATVRRLVTDLRHTRALAITHAARNPEGFALVMQEADPCRSYGIIDQRDRTTVRTGHLPAGVHYTGGRRFVFGPLGDLQTGSDTHLRLRTEGKVYRIEIVPATGAVQWHRDGKKV